MCAQDNDPRYLGFFESFNQQRYFEAHEVLEALWLPQRNGPNGRFYKGLIQLAGAFVHWHKNRPGPAAALFKLARTNLNNYPATHERLSVREVLLMIEQWLGQLAAAPPNVLLPAPIQAPKLGLEKPVHESAEREESD